MASCVDASLVCQQGWSEPLMMAASNRLKIVRADVLRRRTRCDGTAGVPIGCEAFLLPSTGSSS